MNNQDNLFHIPNNWILCKLEDIRVDKSKSISPLKTPDQLFELYSVPAFDNKTPEIEYGINIGSNKQIIEPGTLLLCKINPRINRLWISSENPRYLQIASTEWIPFFKQNEIDNRYIYYFMQKDIFKNFLATNASGVGGSLMRVNANTIREYPIPLPPLAEQRRIVAKIDELYTKLDAGLESLTKAKVQLKQYKRVVLKRAFNGKLTEGWRDKNKDTINPYKVSKIEDPTNSLLYKLPGSWQWVKLGSFGIVSGGLTKNPKRSVLNNKLPYLRVANVYAGRLDLNDIACIGVDDAEIGKLLLKKNDLLVVEGNGSRDQIGRVAIWDGSINPCVHQNHIIKVRFEHTDYVKFVQYWLLTENGRDFITKISSSTSGLYTLSISKVASLPIPVPPLEECNKIINDIEGKLSTLESLETVIDQAISKSDILKQSILNLAFSGHLASHDSAEESARILLERIKVERAKSYSKKKQSNIKEQSSSKQAVLF